MNNNLNIKNEDAVSFINTAKQFCENIEKIEVQNPDEFVVEIYRSLIQLYNDASNLPVFNFTESYAETLMPDKKKLDVALQNIKQYMPFQYYWTVLNPLETETPSIGTGDIIDDLFDIYKDLKPSLTYLQDGSEGSYEFSLWSFKTSFLTHWADHCIDAIHILHKHISEKNELNP